MVKSLLRLFKKKHEIRGYSGPLPDPALYIANHDGAGGPLTLNIYFPKILVPWGAHQMNGRYRDRWNYLYHVFYRQKLRYSKARAFLLSTLFALVSKILYDGVRLIPSYPDARVRHTIAESMEHLRNGNSLLIFPEDSSGGYHETVETFHSGFVYLAQEYRKRNGCDLPIVPLFFDRKSRRIVVGEPRRLGEFGDVSDRRILAERFRLILNDLRDFHPSIN
ncbi:MAG TPA: hypothetical protein P5154_00295 [Candidatus Izemoplasmatales bacterium]|nr:hypothetical protein [Bacillota bacterium]HRY77189.1 hypothetical protein [Candidatus Izemoplasmatales bacterium]